MSRRPAALALVVALVLGSAVLSTSLQPPAPGAAGRGAAVGAPATVGTPTPVPIPGHEVYGYVPYWEMDAGIAEHVARTDLTTLALFSVTHGRDGVLATDQNGYRAISGPVGRRLIAEARERGVRTELVYTSFGNAKNAAFFADQAAQERTIAELVGLAGELGVDGINVDVEQLDIDDVPPYGRFVGRLRSAVRASDEDGQVSVATAANVAGTAMAVAASAAGADRIFMMAYDYHWSGSEPGASAPLGRRDGSEKDLPWSLELYRTAGVPVERTILGLPLYGMSWPVEHSGPGAPRTGDGAPWILSDNLALLTEPGLAPTRDPVEGVEILAVREDAGWRAIYYDSPATLAPKLAMADVRGLAGAGFWAIGYERGLPEYTSLIAVFRAGELEASPTD